MQQRSAKSFQQLYKQICKHYNVPINQGLKNGITDCDIVIILEQINSQDMEPLSVLLSQCKFKSITLRSLQKNLKLNKSVVQDSFRNELLEILKIITKQFTQSLDVLSLTIRDIRLNIDHMQVLAQGIAVVQSLKELRIIQCLITAQHFSVIQPALIQNSSLVCIDLSHNYLTSQITFQLVQLLQEHSKRRDRVQYVYRTRQEDPEEDISLIGVCDLNLSHNKLTDNFVKELIPFLEQDRWLKKLYLKYNQISKEGLEALILMLDTNFTLIRLDVQHNLGVNNQISKEITQKLLRNKTIGKEDIIHKQIEDGEDNILANVSAIPTNLQSQLSYDQESPVMSFGVFDTRNQNNISTNKFKSGMKEYSCADCARWAERSKKQQQIITMLIHENRLLRQKPYQQYQQQQQQQQQQQLQQPQQQQQQQQQQPILKFLDANHPEQEQEDMIDKIEYMMNELTRMMDSLDAQGSATNNITAHLSSTMLGQNNNTRVIYEREDRNNEQLINILEQTSPNTSELQSSQ